MSYGFEFRPDRFPEVYYVEYEEFKSHCEVIGNRDEGTIDYLGVYVNRYDNHDYFQNYGLTPCSKSEEGFIVLFKDRIEHYSKRESLQDSSVRFIVLMHELGHWLTHWAFDRDKNNSFKDLNKNWSVGYHLNNKHTHESLAQLIAFWTCDMNIDLLKALIFLTPKGMRNTEISKIIESGSLNDIPIDVHDPYGRYWLLKEISASDLLSKIKELRRFWMILDLKMFEFLNSEHKEFKTFIGANELNSFEAIVNELIDVDLCEKIFGKYCPHSQMEVNSHSINECYHLRIDIEVLNQLMFPDKEYLRCRRLLERLGL
ncbi:MAG: hypothetical protein WD512_09990 [Candidatus Paceibacterota bacterium]